MPVQPFVTIAMTCFNAEDTILPALEAALQQNYSDFEVLVVDDGSTDSSVPKIKEFMRLHPQVRLIEHRENLGFPVALNSLLEAAVGEYIAFFDDDDTSEPDRLRKQIERIETYSLAHGTEFILCYSDRSVLYDGGKTPSGQCLAIGRKAPEPHGQMVADYLLWSAGAVGFTWGMFGSCTLMVKTSVLRQIGGFDAGFRRCAEWDMAVRAAFLGAHFIAVDEKLVCQKKTLTADKGGKIPLLYALKLREKYRDYLEKKGIYHAALMVARARYYGGRSDRFMARLYMVMACMLSPMLLGGEKIKRALGRLS